MTEFAYSGVGLNPHHDTPRNPWDRATGRIPGGSSSGAAVSVTDGMAVAGLGTDTGGSCRAPAALCGTVGYKPTATRIPKDGVLPLSFTLDSIGSLAPMVACCATLDAVMAGEEPEDVTPWPLDGLRLVAPQTVVLDRLDSAVTDAYGDALMRLSKAGVKIVEAPLAELGDVAALNRLGGFSASEAYAWHRELIAAKGAQYDPRVLTRILGGREQDAAHYIDLIRSRADLIRRVGAISRRYDAMIMPTSPLVAPPIAALATEEEFFAINRLVIRNTTLFNLLDRCAISIPCHRRGDAPVGLMLVGEHGGDRQLFEIAAAVEEIVSPEGSQP
jgi:aspartyl-tRNA(Asn)/glutamyl-tRNA(Gln) amidotransferase subunit A